MKVLLVHQNFPGQYLHLARYLGATPGNQVVFITQRKEGELAGVKKIVYRPRRAATPQVHHYLRESEAAVLNAQEVARVATDLRQSGFVPDVMLGHNGWGEIWYLRDIFPKTPLIGYFEFFYRLQGADVGFDPGDPVTPDTAPRLRTKNLGNLLALDTADLGQCPTHWQKSRYPKRYHSILHVIHEGIDTQTVEPDPTARLRIPNTEVEVAAGDEVVTYVARNLEPYRGFQVFMRSLPAILTRRPNARVFIVGGDEVSYGARLPEGRCYRRRELEGAAWRSRSTRVHFLGRVPYSTFVKVPAGITGARVSDLSVCAVLVDARGHGSRVPRSGLADASRRGSPTRLRERSSGRLLLPLGDRRQGRGSALRPSRARFHPS